MPATKRLRPSARPAPTEFAQAGLLLTLTTFGSGTRNSAKANPRRNDELFSAKHYSSSPAGRVG